MSAAAAKQSVHIVIAEDDDDDFLLTERAFDQIHLSNSVSRVKNGQELLDYFACTETPLPHIVLLDLNMPIMDGMEALNQIKNDERYKHVPVVVLTTSDAQEDKLRSYFNGANSYIRKPVSPAAFIEAIAQLKRYWIDLVELPTTS